MTILIQDVGFTAGDRLLDFTHKRCSKLTKFFNRIIEVKIYLKTEGTQSVKDKTTEITVSVPNKILVAKSEAKKFEEAIDNACANIERQLVKYKEKLSYSN